MEEYTYGINFSLLSALFGLSGVLLLRSAVFLFGFFLLVDLAHLEAGLQAVDELGGDVPDPSEAGPVGNVHVLEPDLVGDQADELLPLDDGGVEDGGLRVDALDELVDVVLRHGHAGEGEALEGAQPQHVARGLDVDNLKGNLKVD